jgi:molybdopterin molybdotransferase
MRKKVSVEEARKILLNLAKQKGTEEVLLTNSINRVLAYNVYANTLIPPFDKSPLDGYVLRGEDTEKASEDSPISLCITEEIVAGKVPEHKVVQGTAAKIQTGAPIPEGANSVVRFEDTRWDNEFVHILNPIKPNDNVIYAGEEVQKNTLILEEGTLITPAVMGMLASQGINICKVYKKPKVAIITIGSELTDVGEQLSYGKIYNINLYTISGYISSLGLECVKIGNIEDNLDKIADRINEALITVDIVITTGGASVGDYDYAISSLNKIGADILFWKVKMKPGMATLAAQKYGKLIIGLSGNPGSAVLGFMRIVQPYLLKCCGRKDVLPEEISVILKNDVKKKSPVGRLLRGKLIIKNGKAFFEENIGQENNMIISFLDFNLIGEIPPESPPIPSGTIIKAYRY